MSSQSYLLPTALETMGLSAPSSLVFLREMDHLLTAAADDVRRCSF